MRSRIAVASLLACGALMSSGGAALGVSALSAPTTASEAQYGPDDMGQPTKGSGDVRDTRVLGAKAPAKGRSGVKGVSDEVSAAKVQASRQLAAGGRNKLPFTGYAAIPLLLGGLLLLGFGVAIRRSTRHGQP